MLKTTGDEQFLAVPRFRRRSTCSMPEGLDKVGLDDDGVERKDGEAGMGKEGEKKRQPMLNLFKMNVKKVVEMEKSFLDDMVLGAGRGAAWGRRIFATSEYFDEQEVLNIGWGRKFPPDFSSKGLRGKGLLYRGIFC